MGGFVFYRPIICDISQIVLENTNLEDFDLKFSESIFDVDIDNPTKCHEVSMIFADFGRNLRTSQVKLTN